MDINLYNDNNLIYIKLQNNINLLNLDNINLIFINKNNYEIIVNINIDNIEKYIEKYNYLLIISYENDGSLIDYFRYKFNLNLINFSRLNLYYVCGIYLNNQIIDFEDIYNELKNVKFIIRNNIINEPDNLLDENIENIKVSIKLLNEKIDDFTNIIKNITLEEMDIKRTTIYLKLNKFEEILDIVINKYSKIELVLNNKQKILEDIENSKTYNKIDEEGFLKDKKIYLDNLTEVINDIDNVKNKKLLELENIENQINNKNNLINKLLSEISNIKKNKNNLLIENNNNKNNLLLENNNNKTNNNKINNDIINNNDKTLIETNSDNLRSVGVFVHIFNLTIWDDIRRYLNNLYKAEYKYDLYVNIALNEINDIEKNEYKKLKIEIEKMNIYNNLYLTYSDNKGMDIGGFMTSYIKMLENKINYKYIVKIHTKTNDNWRFALLYSLLGNKRIIDNNFKLLNKSDVGMVGNQILPLNAGMNKKSYKFIDTYMRRFNIDYSVKGNFIPGTIFIIKNEILKKYFTIDLLKITYNEFEKDYCGSKQNIREGKPHAFERFFGILVENYGKKTVKFDTDL